MKTIVVNRLYRPCLLHLSHVFPLSPVVFLIAGLFAGSALAQPTITNLGVLSGGASPYSFGESISADGFVVTGSSSSSAGQRAFRWSAAGGMVSIGILAGGSSSSGTALSADGAVITGISARSDGNNRAFRWTAAAGMQSIGALGTGTASAGNAISADGSVIAGFSLANGNSGASAFRWTAATGMQNLNLPNGGNAYAISTNGTVIVGSSQEGAFRWTAATGRRLLSLTKDAVDSSAYATSADGSVVAGLVVVDATFNNHAFRSTGLGGGGGGVMQDLGVLDGGTDSVAWGLNADGSVLVGASTLATGDRAILWTATLGMVDLNQYLRARGVNLTGWTLEVARGISADGSAVVGYGTFNGVTRGFLSVAALGNDRVLIGARFGNSGAGVVYLYGTNGTLLKTIPNPAPTAAENFGVSVSSVGSDRILVGAIDYNVGRNGGAAYLFSTNGTLLTTFNNPTPAAFDHFGWSVAAVGSTRVLIGAYQDYSGAARSGSAHLFSTNGTLLNTFTNPTPAVADNFGVSVAAVGRDRVIIGAMGDDTMAPDSGAAYLYDLPYPPLSIARNADTVSVKWVTPETGLILEQTDWIGSPTAWSATSDPASVDGGTNVVQQPIGGTNRFYRLRRR